MKLDQNFFLNMICFDNLTASQSNIIETSDVFEEIFVNFHLLVLPCVTRLRMLSLASVCFDFTGGKEVF